MVTESLLAGTGIDAAAPNPAEVAVSRAAALPVDAATVANRVEPLQEAGADTVVARPARGLDGPER
jgi:hypothetical protein